MPYLYNYPSLLYFLFPNSAALDKISFFLERKQVLHFFYIHCPLKIDVVTQLLRYRGIHTRKNSMHRKIQSRYNN